MGISVDVGEVVSSYARRLNQAANGIASEEVENLLEAILKTRRSGAKVLIAGNGGSAATSQHIAVDWMLGTEIENPPLRVVSLSENIASITATGNDQDFDLVFARQVRYFGGQGDLLLLVSASGNSTNLLLAAKTAKSMGLKVGSITGFDGGCLKQLSDFSLHVPTGLSDYGVAEDIHLAIGHIMKELLIKECSHGE
jgi:D-sedoheptulose 7-phosphate isomerase